jgi:hypothetical protein
VALLSRPAIREKPIQWRPGQLNEYQFPNEIYLVMPFAIVGQHATPIEVLTIIFSLSIEKNITAASIPLMRFPLTCDMGKQRE